jgi:hypothetical protein
MSETLATPFTAEEIRAASPLGLTLRAQVERPPESPVIRVTRYAQVDDAGAVRESWTESTDGRRLVEAQREPSTWLEMQQHAAFPSATTVCESEQLELPLGRFACLRYTRTDPDATWRFWFARDLPGQPVRFEQSVDDRLVFRVTVLSREITR